MGRLYANLQPETGQRAALGSAPLQSAASCVPVGCQVRRPRGWQPSIVQSAPFLVVPPLQHARRYRV